VSEREEIAKRIYWTQHTVMHDHEELWRECKKQFIYLECAESIIEYQRRSQGANALGPCTQAELDQWEKEKDTKTGRILLMWKERAEKAEAALAAQGASGELRQDDARYWEFRGKVEKAALAPILQGGRTEAEILSAVEQLAEAMRLHSAEIASQAPSEASSGLSPPEQAHVRHTDLQLLILEIVETGDWTEGDIAQAILDRYDVLVPRESSSPAALCSCKASQRDGQHMAWCPALSSTAQHPATEDRT
jgi:hypothetical protein